MTGSSLPSRAWRVRLRPNSSSSWLPPAARAPRRLALLAVVAGEQLDDRRADLLEIGAEVEQHLRGDALALADEAEQDVLGADVVVAELQRLAQRQLEHLLGARRERDVAGRHEGALADEVLDLRVDVLERDVERLERLGGDAVLLADQTEQQVLGADVVLVEHARFFLRVDDDPSRLLGESLEHGVLPIATARQAAGWSRCVYRQYTRRD